MTAEGEILVAQAHIERTDGTTEVIELAVTREYTSYGIQDHFSPSLKLEAGDTLTYSMPVIYPGPKAKDEFYFDWDEMVEAAAARAEAESKTIRNPIGGSVHSIGYVKLPTITTKYPRVQKPWYRRAWERATWWRA